jgi:polysaccharide pyruvyl transferase WcaK-like protein
MRHAKEIRIFSSREYNASQMTAILRSLDLLITSRYHAGVLSLDAAVPQIAIGHDQRLCSLYRDLEIYDEYFLDYNAPGLFQLLEERVDNLLQNPVSQQHALRKNNQIQRRRAECNAELLTEFLNKAVWESSEVTYNGQPGEVIT